MFQFYSELTYALEKDNRAVLNETRTLHVLDDGQIWISTRKAEILMADSFGNNFKQIDYSENLTPQPPKLNYIIRNIEKIGNEMLLIKRDVISRRGLSNLEHFLSTDNGESWTEIDSLEAISLIIEKKESDGWVKDSLNSRKCSYKLKSNKSLILDDINQLWLIDRDNVKKLITESVAKRNIKIDSNLNDFYVLCSDSKLYRYKDNKMDSTYIYTNSIDIIPPEDYKLNGDTKWGHTYNHLYYSSVNEENWYRQDVFDFDIYDLHFLNLDKIILWDGSKSYKYSISEKSIIEYQYNSDFIKGFFDYDLTELEIYSGHSSCMSLQKSSVDFESKGEYLQSSISNFNAIYEDSYPSTYIRKITKDSIIKMLTDNILRGLSSFQISDYNDEATINEFLETREWMYEQEDFGSKNTIEENREIDQKFVKLIDTLSQESAEYILGYNLKPYYLLGSWFFFKLKNSNNDSLIVKTSQQSRRNPLNLPWIIQYNSRYNKTYNLELTKFFASLVPEKFYNISISKQGVLQSLYYKLIVIEEEQKKSN